MKICIPIQEEDQKKTQSKLKKIPKKVDLAEVWIDQIENLDLKTLIPGSSLPLIITCKRTLEGGAFKASWNHMAEWLLEAIKFKPSYIDLPFHMPENLNKEIVQSASKNNVKV